MNTGTLKGCTMEELMANGRALADKIRKGEIPEGTSPSEWMIVGGIAVHMPYVPLYQTCDLLSPEDVDRAARSTSQVPGKLEVDG